MLSGWDGSFERRFRQPFGTPAYHVGGVCCDARAKSGRSLGSLSLSPTMGTPKLRPFRVGARGADGPSRNLQRMTAPAHRGPPPSAVLTQIFSARWVAHAVGAAAEFRLADHLAGGPLPAAEVARLAGTDADATRRLLRALASNGIFTETEPGTFANTPVSEVLRSEASRRRSRRAGCAPSCRRPRLRRS